MARIHFLHKMACTCKTSSNIESEKEQNSASGVMGCGSGDCGNLQHCCGGDSIKVDQANAAKLHVEGCE